MASILKVTTTINIESDILGKEAGALVQDAFKAITPAVVKAVDDYVNPKPTPKKEEK